MGQLIHNVSGERYATFRSLSKVPIQSCRCYFQAQQQGSGTTTENNMRELISRTSLKITHHGKNFLHPPYWAFEESNTYTQGTRTWTLNQDGSVLLNGNSTSTGQICNYIDRENSYFMMPYGNYIFNGAPAQPNISQTNVSIRYTRSTSSSVVANDIGQGAQMNITDTKINIGLGLFVAGRYTANNILFKPMVRLQQDDTKWQPYNGKTYTMDWTAIAGALYGGYIDLFDGILVKTWEKFQLTGQQDWTHLWGTDTANGVFRLSSPNNYGYKTALTNNSTNIKANFAVYGSITSSNTSSNRIYFPANNNYLQIRNSLSANLGNNTHEELANQWKTILSTAYNNGTPYYICYKMNPINYQTFQITPCPEIITYTGRNNILGETFDQVDVSYPLIESPEILQLKKRVFAYNSYMMNQ